MRNIFILTDYPLIGACFNMQTKYNETCIFIALREQEYFMVKKEG